MTQMLPPGHYHYLMLKIFSYPGINSGVIGDEINSLFQWYFIPKLLEKIPNLNKFFWRLGIP